MNNPSQNYALTRWLKICLFNLMVVSMLGISLRAKILFPLPFIDQSYLLHGHSHFAFAGWITQALMVLLVDYLSRIAGANKFGEYKFILLANLLTAYGMLFTFPFEGYAFLSISFSFLSLLTSYWFAFRYWRDLNRHQQMDVSAAWLKISLVFNILSSFGTFFLAYLMANKITHERQALASVYFYLHFQYNGWFLFACLGLLNARLLRAGVAAQPLNNIFRIFAIACFPAYFLAALWMHIPSYVYVLVILAAIVEGVAWFWLFMLIKKSSLFQNASSFSKWLWYLSSLAFTVKLLLQIASTYPKLSHIAYGFRPIVIAYLHLVLLGVITLFILGYIFFMQLFSFNKQTVIGAAIFTAGIILNEIVLMIQGLGDMGYIPLPYANVMLLATALIMFAGIAMLFISELKSAEIISYKSNPQD